MIGSEVRGPADQRADSDYQTGFFSAGRRQTNWHASVRGAAYKEDRSNGTVVQVNDTDWRQLSFEAGGFVGGGVLEVHAVGSSQDYFQTFSFVAAESDQSHADNLIACDGFKLAKAAALYGANASGKSNVIKALRAMQSFVLDESDNPFNVVAPGHRPRVTLTPTLALKNGRPFLCFSVQGGDTQDQNLLQFFLNIVEFGMTVQEACEAANITSYQMRSSFGDHTAEPGRLTLNVEVPSWTRRELGRMGYRLEFHDKTSGPITAILFDQEHNSFWGGVSNHGEDYGIAW